MSHRAPPKPSWFDSCALPLIVFVVAVIVAILLWKVFSSA
jgi:hypothetical protein